MKVLLVEDEIKAAKSLSKGLTECDIRVDCAMDAESGIKMAMDTSYDVIVSDIIMPGLSGLELIRTLRKMGLATPVLLLTALNSTDEKVEGLEAGADDYLTKPFEFRELLARIRALYRRGLEPQAAMMVLTFSDITLDLQTREVFRSGSRVDLTPKEFALMEYLLRNPGRTISKKEIAEKVWDIHFVTSSNVVEVYVNYLRNKIDKPYDVRLIHTVFGQGYILREVE